LSALLRLGRGPKISDAKAELKLGRISSHAEVAADHEVRDKVLLALARLGGTRTGGSLIGRNGAEEEGKGWIGKTLKRMRGAGGRRRGIRGRGSRSAETKVEDDVP
jgi:hypothetical protein